MTKNIINNSLIYTIYSVIAVLNVYLSYKLSIIICIMVVAIELLRLLAIYNKVYSIIAITLLMNITLVCYTSYNNYNNAYNKNEIIENERITLTKYVNTKDLRATTLERLLTRAETLETEDTINYIVVIGFYSLLELVLWLLFYLLNRDNKPLPRKIHHTLTIPNKLEDFTNMNKEDFKNKYGLTDNSYRQYKHNIKKMGALND